MTDTTIPGLVREDFEIYAYNLAFISGRSEKRKPGSPATKLLVGMSLFTAASSEEAIVYFNDVEALAPVLGYKEPTKTTYIRLTVSTLSTIVDLIYNRSPMRWFRTFKEDNDEVTFETGILVRPEISIDPPPDRPVFPVDGPSIPELHQFPIDLGSAMWTSAEYPAGSKLLLPVLKLKSSRLEQLDNAVVYFHKEPYVDLPSYDLQTKRYELHMPIAIAHSVERFMKLALSRGIPLRCVAKPLESEKWSIQIETPHLVAI